MNNKNIDKAGENIGKNIGDRHIGQNQTRSRDYHQVLQIIVSNGWLSYKDQRAMLLDGMNLQYNPKDSRFHLYIDKITDKNKNIIRTNLRYIQFCVRSVTGRRNDHETMKLSEDTHFEPTPKTTVLQPFIDLIPDNVRELVLTNV